MRRGTDLALVSPSVVRQFVGSYGHWLLLLGAGAAGLVMSRAVLFGGVAPFGVALVAAAGGRSSLGAALGAMAGYLLFGQGVVWGSQYLAAIVLVIAFKWLFSGRIGDTNVHLAAAGSCLLGLGISGIAMLALSGATAFDSIRTLSEVFLGCGAAYFLSRARYTVASGLIGAGKAEQSCVVIAGCVALMAFSSINIGVLSAGRVLAVVMVLLSARVAREAGGAVAGVAAGVSIALAGGDYTYVIAAYAFGGLSAGLLGQFGKLAAASAFIVVNTGTALLTLEFVGANLAIFEAFVASAIFVAIPQGALARFAPRGLSSPGGEAQIQGSLRERLEDYSAALEDIGSTTREVSRRLSKLEGPGPEVIIERTAGRVCVGCGMKTSCWQLRHSLTMEALTDATSLLRGQGAIPRESIPLHLLQTCCRLDELLGELAVQFSAYTAREGAARKVGKVRSVLTDQFDGMAMMLGEVAAELSAASPFEQEKTERVSQYFTGQGLTVQRLSCMIDGSGRISIELVIPGYQVARISRTKMTLDLCALLETDFDLPALTPREKSTTLLFSEKATFSVELGAYQLPSGKNRLCGDAYDFIRNKSGRAHFILSDGMGSGGAAAVDSAMACDLLIKLVGVGVGYDAALKMVNSALLVKSGDESLATIDVCSVDLFTGRASFYKAGAAPTFIIKSGKAGCLESTSLPAGILHGVSFEKSSVTLHEGDIVVMVSDGVTNTGADWIKAELGGLRSVDMQRLCEKLATTAKMRRHDGHDDDITVLAAALRRGG
ncbi:MAG: SpoIIE family protein phosphatase [Oscillospiraceae bacterium]|nr:SpoIIE family protein phosphatase [Oscillospiraceae bacterium]